MTQVNKNRAESAFNKASIGIIIGLISFIAYQAVDFKDTIITQMDRYEVIQDEYRMEFRSLYDWTHNVYKYEIIHNGALSRKNEQRINKLEPNNTDE